MKIPKSVFLSFLILLNAVPLYGVFYLDWHSFDLIFLYWLENLIIGMFTIGRFLVRRYLHPLELAYPFFLVPFFAVHYGGFCFGHGTFIIGMFGENTLGPIADMGLPDLILPAIESRQLFWPVLALFTYQLLDWIRDSFERGLGNENIKDLMVAPYRRIIVLHITILASGFALAALDEPTIGLIMLIVIKTGSDVYHWHKDEQKVEAEGSEKPVIDENIRKKVDAFLEDPKMTVNGEEIRFNSFEEMKASKHYNMMMAIMRMVGGAHQLEAIEEYVAQRMDERQKVDTTPQVEG